VAMETTGFVSSSIFQELAPLFDLLLFDVKHYNSTIHQAKTGVRNEQIIQNLKWARDQGIDILPRIPVIPNFNDSLEDAKGVANLLKEVGLDTIQLLPFHQMGENKYHLLQREYAYENTKALHPEDLVDYQQAFLDQGIQAFF
ncbi:MAG: radical SAM protein, partial [Allobaculum sp.]|nr:radical SAM protein [Allobaculum sp.]